MKAIGIKIVELTPMNSIAAEELGYKTNNTRDYLKAISGYEVTYPDGYKSWCPKHVVDAAYFILDDKEGNKITDKDLDNFIVKGTSIKLGEKTAVVLDTTITGFDTIGTSACVDSNNYNQEIGDEIAREEIRNKMWGHLGFILQWAKYGINRKTNNNK